MSVAMVVRLQFVPALPQNALPAASGTAPTALLPTRTPQLPLMPQLARLQKNDALLPAPAAAPVRSQPVVQNTAETAAPPWLGALGQAAALEALAGLSEPEASAEAHPPAPSAPAAPAAGAAQQSRGETVTHVNAQAAAPDAAHPPAPPSTVAQPKPISAAGDAPPATSAAVRQAAATTVAQQSHAADNALAHGWLREPPSTMVRPQLPRDLSTWLTLMQRPQAAHLLLRVQEQLVMPMLSRQRLRIGGVIGSDIDSSHETEGARASPITDEVLGVTELPQQRLEGYDLNQPMRLFYDLLSRRRHARRKLTRIER